MEEKVEEKQDKKLLWIVIIVVMSLGILLLTFMLGDAYGRFVASQDYNSSSSFSLNCLNLSAYP